MILHKPNSQQLRRHLWAGMVSIGCCLRGLPLFFQAEPKTPLRVLCLIAFDTLHVLRTQAPLPRHRVRLLASFLDFAACTNAALDHKRFCPREYQANRQGIETMGISSAVDEYVWRLQELEGQRPPPGGDHRRFDEVRLYRESVARLSLGTVAAIALGEKRVADGIRAIDDDYDLATLFRVVMLCQIIDDVLDYADDVSARLPSFLTAAASLSHALTWTAEAARSYAKCPDWPRSAGVFPFRAALFVISVFTTLLIRTRQWRYRLVWTLRSQEQPEPVRSGCASRNR